MCLFLSSWTWKDHTRYCARLLSIYLFITLALQQEHLSQHPVWSLLTGLFLIVPNTRYGCCLPGQGDPNLHRVAKDGWDGAHSIWSGETLLLLANTMENCTEDGGGIKLLSSITFSMERNLNSFVNRQKTLWSKSLSSRCPTWRTRTTPWWKGSSWWCWSWCRSCRGRKRARRRWTALDKDRACSIQLLFSIFMSTYQSQEPMVSSSESFN